jgi:hypothetical protein
LIGQVEHAEPRFSATAEKAIADERVELPEIIAGS